MRQAGGCGGGRLRKFCAFRSARGSGHVGGAAVLSCGEKFKPRPQNPGVSSIAARRRASGSGIDWQSAKQRADAHYRDNQRRSHQAWPAKHGRIGGAWRDRHPEWRAEPGAAVAQSASARGLIAKMDASGGEFERAVRGLPSGAGGRRGDCKDGRVHGESLMIAGPYADGAGAGGGLQGDVMGPGGAVS